MFLQLIRHKYGLPNLRVFQKEVTAAAMVEEKILIKRKSGGEKSLCFQLPAVADEHKVTIVICPSKSTIFDQVSKFQLIRATIMSDNVIQDITSNTPKTNILYLTSEEITKYHNVFSTMTKSTISRIVVDEAHCLSVRGHDFRKNFKDAVLKMVNLFPEAKLMALTATANETIIDDINTFLRIPKEKNFIFGIERKNIMYQVVQKKGHATGLDDLANRLKTKFNGQSGIVFTSNDNECNLVANQLRKHQIQVSTYHSQITDEERRVLHQDWQQPNRPMIVIATHEFGIGVSRPNVSFTIHFSLPKSLESYYQEAGRAGHDKAISTSIIYYYYADKKNHLDEIERGIPGSKDSSLSNLTAVIDYCDNLLNCRAKIIYDRLRKPLEDSVQCFPDTKCDNCSRNDTEEVKIDATQCRKIIEEIRKMTRQKEQHTILQFAQTFKTQKMFPENWKVDDIVRLLHKLVSERFINEQITVENINIKHTYIYLSDRSIDDKLIISFTMLKNNEKLNVK